MTFEKLLDEVGAYYTGKLAAHGASAKGVDWNSPESQKNRFDQLLKVTRPEVPFSIIDYGCGYGALVEHMREARLRFQYQGFDIAEQMVKKARELFGAGADGLGSPSARGGRASPDQGPARPECRFTAEEASLVPADFAVASGIFNVKLERTDEAWVPYVLETIGKLDRLGLKGFAFNVLTKYSDKEYMRPHLHYADPCFLFDYVKTRFSRQVALLHDYGLYEFTILVRKGES